MIQEAIDYFAQHPDAVYYEHPTDGRIMNPHPVSAPAVEAPVEGRITFVLGHPHHAECLRFEPDGAIYVQGRLVERDIDVVGALRAFVGNPGRIDCHPAKMLSLVLSQLDSDTLIAELHRRGHTARREKFGH